LERNKKREEEEVVVVIPRIDLADTLFLSVLMVFDG
jgi:hypothetical protein